MFNKRVLLVLLVAGLTLSLVAGAAFAQVGGGGSRDECAQKAKETIDNLDKWILEYSRQMNAAEPVQKPKYKEWIRELKKLKSMVTKASEKLDSKEACSGDACIEDQCSLVDIADQQVAQLIKETEEQLGSASRFGSEGARDVTIEDDMMGNDDQLGGPDANDANQSSYADKSGSSDNQSQGNAGQDDDDQGDDGNDDVPPADDKQPASPE